MRRSLCVGTMSPCRILVPTMLNDCEKLQMDMALEVKRLCDKHNLRVFLAYGSLLGAVRHKGFIPWDDDIDLWMPRSDYEAFMRLCEKDLAPRWQLQTIETDPALGQLLAKIRARGTRFVHRNSTQVDMDQGIYIDLFPIDNAPDGKVRRRLHAGIHYVLRREMVRRSGYGLSRRGERWAKLIRVPMLLVPTRTVIRLLKRNATRYNAVDTRSMVSLAGAYPYRKEVLCRDWFADRTSFDLRRP